MSRQGFLVLSGDRTFLLTTPLRRISTLLSRCTLLQQVLLVELGHLYTLYPHRCQEDCPLK
jgi:hypothetical protein